MNQNLIEQVQTMFYKQSIKADDIVKAMVADTKTFPDPEKAKKFVYVILHIPYDPPAVKALKNS